MPKVIGDTEDEIVFLGAMCAAAVVQFRQGAYDALTRAAEPPPPTPDDLKASVEDIQNAWRRLGQEMNQVAASIEAALGSGGGGLITVDRRKLRLAVRAFNRYRDADADIGPVYERAIGASLAVTQPAGRA